MNLTTATLALLPIVAAIGLTAPKETSHPLESGAPLRLSADFGTSTQTPDAWSPILNSLTSVRYTIPSQPEHKPHVAANAEQWFNKNARTIAIVAVAVILVIIIAD